MTISVFLAALVPLNNFDIIEYVLGGEFFARTRAIVYNGYFVDPANGFVYFTYHSFLMPLFATFGVFLSETLSLPQDWYIKFLNGYYWTLLNIASAIFLCRRKKEHSWLLPVCAMLLLNAVPIIGDRLISFGIDFFRLACFVVGIGVMWEFIKKPSSCKAVITCLLLSAAAAAHLVQACLVPLLCLCPFVIEKDWRSKIYYTLAIGFGILLLGYLHYFLQIFYGDRWLWAIPTELTSTDYPQHQQKILLRQVAEGYLGIFFNFEFYSLASIATLGIFLAAICKKGEIKFTVPRVLISGFILFGIFLIAIRAYANYRYSFTLYYLIILSIFGTLSGIKKCRKIYAAIVASVILTMLYSAVIFIKHIEDIRGYVSKTGTTHRTEAKFFSPEEFFSVLQKDKPSRVALWAKNKTLQRYNVPLCYISPCGSINWQRYRNDLFPVYETAQDSFINTLMKNFSHVIIDNNVEIDARKKLAFSQNATLLLATDKYSIYRLNQ